ncbi:hypothetical protein ITJ64_11020 [Herbiconiux sp. VKM Ac-1786]|uniref:hypothetical protein n=1 Tax=Herbiconiux sp. VKM Ac-1786 TaxID=2783824 RepID=UPI00188AC40A|nr:hypothetical protein [Herbiconiux sp. VKM Ac-1786]MBF4573049.1 hypothetical protein [Herbiconiux sp. VKM Ac-1786]
MAGTGDGELESLVAELRAENARLRAEAEASAAASTAAEPSEGRPPRGWWSGWGRAGASAALVVVGLLVAPVAVVADWGETQLVDTEAFVQTFAPLARDEAVQAFVVSEVMAVVSDAVDFEQTTGEVFDAVGDLGLPPAADRALQALQVPAALGLESLATSVVTEVVQSPAFADVWAQALRVSHGQLVAALSGDPTAALAISSSGEVAVQLGPVVQAVKAAMVDRGLTIAAAIPEVDVSVVVAKSDSFGQLVLAYGLAVGLGLWLPWICLVLLAGGVLLARRRAVAVLRTGVALGVVMVLVGLAIRIGSLVTVAAVAPRYLPIDAARVIYDTVTARVGETVVAIAVLGFTIALIAWVRGPLRPAPAVRAAFASGAVRLRRYGDSRAITTGAFGRWLGRNRVAVEVLIGVAAAAVILAVRPIGTGRIVLTAVVALVLLVLVELLQRPPTSGAPTGPADDSVAV